MARKVENPLDVIRADVTHKYNEALKEIAGEVTYQIESAYESVIQKFYDEYPQPRSYQRTYSTYLGSNKYDDEFGYTPVGDILQAGITVGHENIPGHPYRAATDWVFSRTFLEGIHGYFKVEYQQWMDNRFKRHKWSKAKTAREKARVEKMLAHAPRKSTPPKQGMDNQFKKLTSQRNMNKISKSILNKTFRGK